MRRKALLLSALVVLVCALASGIETALAGRAVSQAPTVTSSADQVPACGGPPCGAGVSVIKDGTGSGTVSSLPGGIDCGPRCATNFPWHTQVTLTATPALGSTFTGWSAGCPATGTCRVTAGCGGAACVMTTVTATFTLTSDIPNTLSVANPTGWGTVTSVPAGIDCGATCSHEYPLGTSISLSATPGYGSSFTGWSGACTGRGTCNVQIRGQAGVAVRATFAVVPHCVVPRLKGKMLAAAKRSIQSQNCAVGRIKQVASRTVNKGRVIAQTPKPGRRLPLKAKVNLVVSRGGH